MLTGEWIVVSPHRTQRPWRGHQQQLHDPSSSYASDCYLCPGNKRAGGQSNPAYKSVFVFDNDYPALLHDVENIELDEQFFKTESIIGCCRVICYGPRHDLALHQLDQDSLLAVINEWRRQSAELSADFEWVQIFENRGALMGASSPHPHGQIWALDKLPTEPFKELVRQSEYQKRYGSILLCDYVDHELALKERIVYQNEHWVALVPYWAIWPYETLVIPREATPHLHDLNVNQSNALSDLWKQLFGCYDAMFDAPISFSMGWHSAPRSHAQGWQLHAHIYPPALRSPSVPKFMVGFELLAEKQRDITAEYAAARLRGEIA